MVWQVIGGQLILKGIGFEIDKEKNKIIMKHFDQDVIREAVKLLHEEMNM